MGRLQYWLEPPSLSQYHRFRIPRMMEGAQRTQNLQFNIICRWKWALMTQCNGQAGVKICFIFIVPPLHWWILTSPMKPANLVKKKQFRFMFPLLNSSFAHITFFFSKLNWRYIFPFVSSAQSVTPTDLHWHWLQRAHLIVVHICEVNILHLDRKFAFNYWQWGG